MYGAKCRSVPADLIYSCRAHQLAKHHEDEKCRNANLGRNHQRANHEKRAGYSTDKCP